MKTYEEIKKKIENIKKKTSTKYKNEYEELLAMLRQNRVELLRSGGVDAYKQKKIELRLDEIEDKYIKECQNNDKIKIQKQILIENAKHAVFNENISKICDIWNKYVGKPYGEKTREKIFEEIKNECGLYVYISNQYGATLNIRHATRGELFWQSGFSASSIITDGNRAQALDGYNKVQELTPELLRIDFCGDYVEDVQKHINELFKAYKKAKQAEKQYNQAIKEYNALTRGEIQRFNPREGVKNYII